MRTTPRPAVSAWTVAFALLLWVSGCYRVRSQLVDAPSPAPDLYRCVQLELARSGYAIVGADRQSGWLHAQKRIERLLETVQAEIYATVIPDDASGGAHLQLTDNSHAEEDADRILALCAAGATEARGEIAPRRAHECDVVDTDRRSEEESVKGVALAGRVAIIAAAWVLAGCAGVSERPADDATRSDTVRVLAYNIHHGEGLDSVLDLERIAALIRDVDPDLVTLQEVDSVVARTDGVDQAEVLERLTGLETVFGRFMPYQGGAYGMAVMSRWPIAASVNHRLPDGDEPRTALSATVTLPGTGRLLRLVGIHFYRTDEERLAQAMALEEQLLSDTVPTILAGDFNSTPGSEVMLHLSRSWSVVEKGEDRFTFSSDAPVREIDFVLLRPATRFEVLSERVLDEPVASDHRPVLVDLVIRGAGDG